VKEATPPSPPPQVNYPPSPTPLVAAPPPPPPQPQQQHCQPKIEGNPTGHLVYKTIKILINNYYRRSYLFHVHSNPSEIRFCYHQSIYQIYIT